jgi:hypothetical protein
VAAGAVAVGGRVKVADQPAACFAAARPGGCVGAGGPSDRFGTGQRPGRPRDGRRLLDGGRGKLAGASRGK